MNKEELLSMIKKNPFENQHQEFKGYVFTNGQLKNIGESEVEKLLKSICAFSNTNGGNIIIGLKDNGSEFVDTNIDKTNFDSWCLSLRDKLNSKTIPVISNIDIHHMEIENKNIIVLSIPKSMNSPHAFNNNGKHEFFYRNGNQNNHIQYNELRDKFTILDSRIENIKSFINERFNYIDKGELGNSLKTSPTIIIHLIPEWSMSEENFLELSKIKDSAYFMNIRNWSSSRDYYNSDGLITIQKLEDDYIKSYTQFFTNGRIETVNANILNKYGDVLINWDFTESFIFKNIVDHINGLKSFKIYGDFYISVILNNIQGLKIKSFEFDYNTIDNNIFRSKLIKFNNEIIEDDNFKQLFTTLSYAVGASKSTFYNEDGSLNQEKFNSLLKK